MPAFQIGEQFQKRSHGIRLHGGLDRPAPKEFRGGVAAAKSNVADIAVGWVIGKKISDEDGDGAEQGAGSGCQRNSQT